MLRRRQTPLAVAVFLSLTTACAQAAPAGGCANMDAIGTARIVQIDTRNIVAIGRSQKTFAESAASAPTLLRKGEIALTFDDGPVPQITPKILDILTHECIGATFFMIGKRAEAAPELARRLREAGHTLGSHSWSHVKLSGLPADRAIDDIRKGYEAVERAAYGAPRPPDAPRLFRFPEWSATPALLDFTHGRNITAVGADISPTDWRGHPPEVTLARLRELLDKADRGIIVLHDNQKNTVALLPALLAELKARGLKIVQLMPKS